MFSTAFWIFYKGVGVRLVCGSLDILTVVSKEISFPYAFILQLPIFGMTVVLCS